MESTHHNDSGFTLVEVMTVLVIIAVLLSIAIATYFAATERTTAVACDHNRRLLERAADSMLRPGGSNETSITIDALEPYVVNWNSVSTCPSDSTLKLDFDTDGMTVVCPKHGR